MAKIKLATTLYSFTNEQRDWGWTTEDCLREIKQLGLDGVEFVASQTFDNYPYVTEKQLDELRNLTERYGLEISSYSAQGDRGKRSDRQDMTDDEMFAYAMLDLKNAYKVGAKAQRQQNQVHPEVMRRIAPYAEAYGVRIGVEMHSPMVPTEKAILPFNKVFDEVNSPYIGWTPDFGMFDTASPQLKPRTESSSMFSRFIPSRVNIPEEVCEWYQQNARNMTTSEILEAVKKFNMTEKQYADFCVMFEGMNAATDEERARLWEDFEKVTIPHAVYFHGKFNEIGETGDDVSIHTSRVLDIINRSDYEGYISIEYEGHGRFPNTPVVPILRKHVEFYRSVLGL